MKYESSEAQNDGGSKPQHTLLSGFWSGPGIPTSHSIYLSPTMCLRGGLRCFALSVFGCGRQTRANTFGQNVSWISADSAAVTDSFFGPVAMRV
jgi:hypothetical protein